MKLLPLLLAGAAFALPAAASAQPSAPQGDVTLAQVETLPSGEPNVVRCPDVEAAARLASFDFGE